MPSATDIGKVKALGDIALRFSTTGALTVLGAAQNKGTATNLLLVILDGPDGANAVGGTTNIVVQGSNVTASASSNWTSIAPDKGTLAAFTASGSAVLHYAQLQSQFYRVSVNCTTSATANVNCTWAFLPMEDSFDASVQ
jgi:hypothetical protein